METETFLARVDALAIRAGLAPLDAAILLAVDEGAAPDSRTFAKVFGVAHALVLRAVATLDGRFVTVMSRDPRTQRTQLELTPFARAMLAGEPERAAA
jgi:hypothetical protein